MALTPVVGKSTPDFSAQRKERVPFKNFHAKRIYVSFELQTIKMTPKLTWITNIHLWSVGSSRELFTKKKSGTGITSKWISLVVNMYSSHNVLEIFTPMAAGWSCMLELVETLVGWSLGSLRGLGRGLGRQKLLKTDNYSVSARCPRI